MNDPLTPRQLARALGVGESTIKRWCDRGIIKMQLTAGRHRRIPLTAALEFVRNGNHTIVNPQAMGMPATSGRTSRVTARALERLVDALLGGKEAECRQIAADLYLAGHNPSVICDECIAKAFELIGDQWQCGDAEVYQERRACEIALRMLHDLRQMIPAAADDDTMLAIGGTPTRDQYTLGTTMAELVLKSAGWNAISLGDNLPFATLSAAIEKHRPVLFWLSCSHIENETQFIEEYTSLFEQHGSQVAFVVGGFALSEALRRQMKYASFCDSMQHLESFASTLRGAASNKKAEER